MPTPRQNSRAGCRGRSTSASSSWRKVDSDSNTPAGRACHRRPPQSMNNAGSGRREAPRRSSLRARRSGRESRTAGSSANGRRRTPEPTRRSRSRRSATGAGAVSASRGRPAHDQRQQRDDRQVLKEEDCDRTLTGGLLVSPRSSSIFIMRRSRTGRTDCAQIMAAAAGQSDGDADTASAGEHLDEAQPNMSLHIAQSLAGRMEPDQKQEHDDAELGDVEIASGSANSLRT